jgi:hypothetical protein
LEAHSGHAEAKETNEAPRSATTDCEDSMLL